MKMLRVFLGVLTPLYLASAVFASTALELLYKKSGPGAGARMGTSVAGGQDVDGDGLSDFIVGAPDSGVAFIYSGSNGALIHTVRGSGDFGFSVALLGDIYGNDGKSEFIIGAPHDAPERAGAAYVYSGADTSLIAEYHGNSHSNHRGDQLGFAVAGLGDVDSSGKPDFIIGSRNYTDEYSFPARWELGSATVYRGENLSGLATYYGSNENDHFGFAVSGAGDQNLDGWADFIIGAPDADLQGLSERGAVYIYSGKTLGQLYSAKYGAATGDGFGWSVSVVGDVNADNKSELIVGAPKNDNGGTDAGAVYVYYGGGLPDPLYAKYGDADGAHFGLSVAGAGRINFDGTPDFIIGAPGKNSGQGIAYLYAGGNGALLETVMGSTNYDSLGTSVAGGGNMVSPSSYDEFIVGAPLTDTTDASERGTAYVYHYDPAPPSVTVTSPNGGEYVSKSPCPPFTVTWNATDNVGVTGIKIWLDRFNDGYFELQIANLSGNPGSFDWAPTGTSSNAAKIKVIAYDGAGNSSSDVSDGAFRIGPYCYVKPAVILPTFDLDQNYPNPFNANTNISFSLDATSRVELMVYNILGEKVRTLISEERAAGTHEVAFDGRDDKGRTLSSGTYFCKLTAGDRIVTKQMVLIK